MGEGVCGARSEGWTQSELVLGENYKTKGWGSGRAHRGVTIQTAVTSRFHSGSKTQGKTILLINALHFQTQWMWVMMLHWEAASEVRLKLHLVRYPGAEFVDGT